jgi:hypothetical protein
VTGTSRPDFAHDHLTSAAFTWSLATIWREPSSASSIN